MDVEITKLNGDIFKLSDYNIVVRDFRVSSPEIRENYGEVSGRDGLIDRGIELGRREIVVPFFIDADDLHGVAKLRDKLFDLVLDKRPFYIRELRRNVYQTGDNKFVEEKRYKVRISESFDIEQEFTYGFGELVFETTDLPFAESVRTTLEGITSAALLGSGHDFNSGDYYVMIDDGKISLWNNVDDVDYYFITHSQIIEESNEFVEGVYGRNLISHDPSNWEQGTIYTNGNQGVAEDRIRMDGYLEIDNDTEYTIKNHSSDKVEDSRISVRVYDGNKDIIESYSSIRDELSFVTSTRARFLRVVFLANDTIRPSDVEDSLKCKLEKGSKSTEWTKPPEDLSFKEAEERQARAYIITKEEYDAIRLGQMSYEQVLENYPYDELVGYTFTLTSDDEVNVVNLGNVDVHPFQQYLRIVVENVQGTQGAFRLVNLTNNTEFSFLGGLRSSDVIIVDGPRVRFNNNEAFRRTRRTYIQMSSGDNRFAIEGADSADVTFDFRFYYK